MFIRHWDPNGEHEGAVLKIYPHWSLEVSWQQHTIGSFIIFCRREAVRLISQLTQDEVCSLRDVMGEIELALREHPSLRADHFNYWQMGNFLPLLHLHGIPRYETRRNFRGQTFVDPTWGHPPLWSRERVDRELVEQLVTELQPLLSR